MLLPPSVSQGTNPAVFSLPNSYPSCHLHSSPPGDSHSALTWLIKDDTKLASNIALVSSTRLIAAARGSGSCRNRALFTAAVTGQTLEVSWCCGAGCWMPTHSGTGTTQGQHLDGAWKTNESRREAGRAARLSLRKSRAFVSVRDLTSSLMAISSKSSTLTTA